MGKPPGMGCGDGRGPGPGGNTGAGCGPGCGCGNGEGTARSAFAFAMRSPAAIGYCAWISCANAWSLLGSCSVVSAPSTALCIAGGMIGSSENGLGAGAGAGAGEGCGWGPGCGCGVGPGTGAGDGIERNAASLSRSACAAYV